MYYIALSENWVIHAVDPRISFPKAEEETGAYWKEIDAFHTQLKKSEGRPGEHFPVFEVFDQPFSWRDIILVAGGVFLVYKATAEIHEEFEGETEEMQAERLSTASFASIIGQIIIIDLVFSVDSIVTAIGMAEHVEVMIAAVFVAVAVMFIASGTISSFIRRHPTTKMLALAFLLLIGVSLTADGFGFHIPRGYIYAAMGFSVLVEAINILAGRNKRKRAGT